MRFRESFAIHRWILATVLLLATVPFAGAEELDSRMYRSPDVPVAAIRKTYPKGLAELWLAALERPERDIQSRAAQAIAAAHERGMPGLQVTVGPLQRLVELKDQHPSVLAAAARALVALDARDSAPALLNLTRSGTPTLREIVDPALARWQYPPARDIWLERLQQPPPHGRGLMEAARWLGTVRDDRAIPRLRELAFTESVDGPVRLAAARALAEIRRDGLAPDAAKLAADKTGRGTTNRLVAASLLKHHAGDEVVRLLQELTRDSEPVIALTALGRLAEIDTRHVLPVLEAVLSSPDAGVRGIGVHALHRHPSNENIRLLGLRLSDPHPDVRISARTALLELAGSWRPDVIEAGQRALDAFGASAWRGHEQAAILLARLDHKPASKRLVELLRSNRSEVLVAVGWALQQLAVPETLPSVLEHVRTRHSEMLLSGSNAGLRGVSPRALDLHLSHLIQFLGEARHEPASPVLRAIVPRFLKPGMPPVFSPVGAESRAAAIWSLGLIHEGKPEARLVALIQQRLTGDGAMGRDDPRVRRMVAVSLARLKARESLDVLREFSAGQAPDTDIVANACRWAVGQLTGEPVPPAGEVEQLQRDWFLVPLK